MANFDIPKWVVVWAGMTAGLWSEITPQRQAVDKLVFCFTAKNIDIFIPMLIFTNLDVTHGSAHFSAPHHCHLNLSSHPLSLHLLLDLTPLGYKLPSLCLNCTTESCLCPCCLECGMVVRTVQGSEHPNRQPWTNRTGAEQFRGAFQLGLLEVPSCL